MVSEPAASPGSKGTVTVGNPRSAAVKVSVRPRALAHEDYESTRGLSEPAASPGSKGTATIENRCSAAVNVIVRLRALAHELYASKATPPAPNPPVGPLL